MNTQTVNSFTPFMPEMKKPASTLSNPKLDKTGRPTLLLVDDEERILRSLRLLFAQRYQIRMTTNGHEALDILKTEKIHALISDQRMPIMLGVDLLRQARNIAPNTMRLLLTGYSDMEAIERSINEGEIFRYIHKPWDATEIRNTVENAVEIALSLDKLPAPGNEIETPPLHGRILVIDEDPNSFSAIESLLQTNMPNQCIVEWAPTLEMMMDILAQQDVCLVIAEARLGQTDLTDLVKLLKQYNPQIITILLTTFRDANVLINMVNQAQIFRFLPKPLRSHLTWIAIKAGLERAQTFKQTPELLIRHKVEVTPQQTETPLAKRFLGLFSRIGKRLHA